LQIANRSCDDKADSLLLSISYSVFQIQGCFLGVIVKKLKGISQNFAFLQTVLKLEIIQKIALVKI
jgi:hypothetical protein